MKRRKLGAIATALLAAVVTAGVGGTAAYAGAPDGVVTPSAAQKVLTYQYQVQQTGYWCSAAAARIALTARGKYPSQQQLASYMHVGTAGLPNIKNLENGLDHFEGTTYYQVKQWSSDAQLRDKLRADVLYNVDRGHAVVINVLRIANAHFPGGHYAAIVGYRGGGSEYLIADPASASRQSIWLTANDVASGIKLRRYVA